MCFPVLPKLPLLPDVAHSELVAHHIARYGDVPLLIVPAPTPPAFVPLPTSRMPQVHVSSRESLPRLSAGPSLADQQQLHHGRAAIRYLPTKLPLRLNLGFR